MVQDINVIFLVIKCDHISQERVEINQLILTKESK